MPLLPPDKLDDATVAYTLEVPASSIVLIQALFETYEGIAVVRTINVKRSLISVITTPELSATCAEIIHDLAPLVPWRSVPHPEGADVERKLGDFR